MATHLHILSAFSRCAVCGQEGVYNAEAVPEGDHPIFTQFSWADLPGKGLTRETGNQLGWMKLHDLAVRALDQTKEFCALSFESWRELISATAAGLPITLTYLSGRQSTVVVDQILSLAENTTANLYYRGWGFAGPIALSDLASVDVPPTIYPPV